MDYKLSGIKMNVFIGNQDSAKKQLTELIKTLENNKITLKVDFKDVKDQINEITKLYENAGKLQASSVEETQKKIKKIYSQSNSEIKKMVEQQRKILEGEYGNKGKVNYTYSTDQFGNNRISSAFLEIKNQAQETEKVMFGLRESINTVGNEVQKIYTFGNTGKKEILNLKQADKDVSSFSNTVSNTRKKYENEIQKIINKNKDLSNDGSIVAFKSRLENLDKFNFDELPQELKALQLEFNKIKIGFQQTGSLTQTSNNLFKRVGQYFTATTIYYEMANAIKYAVQNIQDLDDSLVELSKVSQVSRENFGQFVNEANQIGNALGKTSKDVIDAVTSFQRADYDLTESKDLAKSALIMANISENMKDTGENASALINILKGYKMEVSSVTKINDVFNNISNNMAVNFDTLVKGSREIAGVMNIYGNSLENTAAMITSIVEVMGTSGEETANALKTISLRLSGLTDTGEEDVELMAKLNDEFEKIAKMSLTDANGQLKSTFEIVDEYSRKVKELNLSKETQSYLGELVAGKHRASYWMAMVQNFDSARQAMDYASSSLNSSLEEQEKYVNSLSGQIEILKSSIMSLSYNTVNTDWVIDLVKGTNEVIKLIDKIGIANIAMATFVGYLSAKGKLGVFNSVINSIVASITTYTSTVTGATATTLAFGTAMKAVVGVGIVAAIGGTIAIFDALNVTVEEQTQKVNKLQDGYNSLSSELEKLKGIENPTDANERTIALLERELELREKILAIEKEKLTNKQFNSNYSSIQGDLEALENAIKAYEKKQKQILETGGDASQFATLESRKNDLLRYAEEANKTLTSLSEIYDDLNPQQKEQADIMMTQAEKTLKLSDDILGLNIQSKSQIDTNKEVAKSFEEIKLEKMQNDLSLLLDKYDDNVEGIGLLNSAINSLSDSQTLTGDTILSLLEKYPELRSQVTETNGVFSISKQALLDLRDQSVETFGTMINKQRDATNEAITNAKTRISSYTQELTQLKKLASAQSLMGAFDSNKKALGYNSLTREKFSGEIDATIKDKEAQLKQEQANMQKYLDMIEKINISEQDFSIATSTENTKKGSNITNKKPKSEKDDAFKKELDNIKKFREEKQRQIDLLQEQINLSTLKGEDITLLSQQMLGLKQNLIGVADEEIRRYGNLTKTFKKEEEISELEELIGDSRKQRLVDEQDLLNYHMELLENKKDILTKHLDDMDLEKSSLDSKLKILEATNAIYEEQILLHDQIIDKENIRANYLELTINDLYKQRDVLDSTSKQYKYMTEMIVDFESQYADAIQKQADSKQKIIDMMYEELELALEKSIYGDGGQSAWESKQDRKIESLNEELDLLKSQSEEKKKQLQAEERALELKKLQEQLENAKRQKTIQEFKKQSDGSWQWEYVADAERISDLESQIAQKKKEEEIRLEEEKQAKLEQSLRDEIERINKEKQAKQKFFEESKQDLLAYLNDNKDKLVVNGEEVLGIVTSNMDIINAEFDTKMDLITDSLETKLSKIKSLFQDALSMGASMGNIGGSSGSSDGKPTYSGTGGSGKTYFQYGDGTIEVLRPNGTSSTVKPSDKNYSSTVSAMEKDHVKKKYKDGGETETTGLHWLDGELGKPERVLSYEQNKAFMLGMKNIPRFNFEIAALMNKINLHKDVNNIGARESVNSGNKPSINIQKIELPNVSNGKDFVDELEVIANGILYKSKLVPR